MLSLQENIGTMSVCLEVFSSFVDSPFLWKIMNLLFLLF